MYDILIEVLHGGGKFVTFHLPSCHVVELENEKETVRTDPGV